MTAPTATASAARSTTRPMAARAVLILPAAAALLAGLDAGLQLLGVTAPVSSTGLRDAHGILMVLGFVGSLIALERAVALGHPAGYLSPALISAGSLLALTTLPLAVSRSVLLAGMVALGIVHVQLWRRQRDDAVLVQVMGVILGIGATTMWLGGAGIPQVVPWLSAFLVLVIAGERLELARLAMGPGAGGVLVMIAAAVMSAAAAAVLWPHAGQIAFGLALIVLCTWLAVHDVARRTIHATGVPRFAAAGLLTGYFWLLTAGVTWALGAGGTAYDVVVHAVFLGFVISMIMVHAPVIFPAILRRPLRYHPSLWGPLVLLHIGLVVRLWAGDALGSRVAWQVGGVVNEIALLAFLVMAVGLVLLPAPGRRS